MPYVIRKMQKKDLKAVQHIAWVSWHETYKRIIPRHIREQFLNIAYSEQQLKRRMKRSYFLVSEFREHVVGFAQFKIPDEAGKTHLVALYLCPAYQGRGIGTFLLEQGIHFLGHVTEVSLHVERANTQARRFYEVNGFEFVAQFTQDFYGHVLNTIQMRLRLRERSNSKPKK